MSPSELFANVYWIYNSFATVLMLKSAISETLRYSELLKYCSSKTIAVMETKFIFEGINVEDQDLINTFGRVGYRIDYRKRVHTSYF